MMAVMKTIKQEVKCSVISDFYQKNLIKRKALDLKAFFKEWLLVRNNTPIDGKSGCWVERGASHGSKLSSKPQQGLIKLSKKGEKKIKLEHPLPLLHPVTMSTS